MVFDLVAVAHHKIMHFSISLRIVSFEDPDLIMSETLDSFFIDPE